MIVDPDVVVVVLNCLMLSSCRWRRRWLRVGVGLLLRSSTRFVVDGDVDVVAS